MWGSGLDGAETSQHLTDWYSFSHVIHGFLLYAALWFLVERTGWRLALGARFLIATIVECGWEMLKNSSFIIDRYRETTMSLGYYGDSIVNSMGDILCMMVGFSHRGTPAGLDDGHPGRHYGAGRRLLDQGQSDAEHHHAGLPDRGH
jgi:Protein of unknown function (DUF2585)